MSLFFERRRTFDLAAALLVVFVAVSIGDIADYDMHAAAMSTPVKTSMTLNATADIASATSEAGSDSHRVCACLLCVLTITDSFGPRIIPPSPGKLSTPVVPGLAGSPHISEVFHPPSA